MFCLLIGAAFGAAPTIDDVKINGEDAPAINPVESSDAVVTVTFNVTDTDGAGNIDLTSAYANDTTDSITNTSCEWGSFSDIDTKEIECQLSLYYYTAGGPKSIEVYVEDDEDNSDMNDTHGFTYNTIYVISLNLSTLDFGSMNINTSNNPAPLRITNGGNGIVDLSIKGSNMENGLSVLEIGNCTVDDDSTADEGGETGKNEMALTTSAQDYSPTGGLAVQGTLDWWFFLDVPLGLASGTYNSASSWEIVSSSHS